MQIRPRNRCCRTAVVLAALLVSGAAWAGMAQASGEEDSGEEDSGYEFARVTYAADYCTQLRWERPEVDDKGDADIDEAADANSSRAPTLSATSGASVAAASHDSAGGAEKRSAEAEAAPDSAELLLSSRFNHESCEDAKVGAVVDDKAQLPLLVAALQAVHEALAVQPDWIDDSNLPLDWQGCWRRGARLSEAWGDSDDGGVALYLDIQDCAGAARLLRLELQPADAEQPQGYRRRGGILATRAPTAVCGTLE